MGNMRSHFQERERIERAREKEREARSVGLFRANLFANRVQSISFPSLTPLHSPPLFFNCDFIALGPLDPIQCPPGGNLLFSLYVSLSFSLSVCIPLTA